MLTKNSRKVISTKLDYLYNMRDKCDDEHNICAYKMLSENVFPLVQKSIEHLFYTQQGVCRTFVLYRSGIIEQKRTKYEQMC